MADVGPIRLRGGTVTSWEKCNTVLAYRECGLLYDDDETHVLGIKFGDNIRGWNELPFFTPFPKVVLRNTSELTKPEALVYRPTYNCIILADTTRGPVQLELSPGLDLDIQLVDIGGFADTYPIILTGLESALINRQTQITLSSPYMQTRLVSVPYTDDWVCTMPDRTSGVLIDWDNILNKPSEFPPALHAQTHYEGGSDPINSAVLFENYEVQWDDVARKPDHFPSSWDKISNKPAAYPPTVDVYQRLDIAESSILTLQQQATKLGIYSMGMPDWSLSSVNVAYPFIIPDNGYLIMNLDVATTVTLDDIAVASTGATTSSRAFIPVKKGQRAAIAEGTILDSVYVMAAGANDGGILNTPDNTGNENTGKDPDPGTGDGTENGNASGSGDGDDFDKPPFIDNGEDL